jgi:hypothetical protein
MSSIPAKTSTAGQAGSGTRAGSIMPFIRTELPKQPPRRRGWFRPFNVAVVAIVVGSGIAVQTGWHYRSHLLWRYEASRLDVHDFEAIPDSPMPDSPAPDGWVRCRVGCIEFGLPRELAGNKVAQKNGASFVVFQHGPRTVIVTLPSDGSEYADLLSAASKLCPQSQRFTMPRLRRECYQANPDDFRWSMTPDEVRWHAFCIITGKLIRPKSGGHTESFFRQDLDGIAHFGDPRDLLDWQSCDHSHAGYMYFIDRGEKSDKTWIRAVCQSLTLVSEVDGKGARNR